jgi:hypothetical protein
MEGRPLEPGRMIARFAIGLGESGNSIGARAHRR